MTVRRAAHDVKSRNDATIGGKMHENFGGRRGKRRPLGFVEGVEHWGWVGGFREQKKIPYARSFGIRD